MRLMLMVAGLMSAGVALAGAMPAAPPAPAAAATATLTVRFEQLAAPGGQIMLGLYDSEAAHDGNGKPVRAAAVPVSDGAAVTVLAGLPAGRYAIKAFHDVDGDGQMKMNPFGTPLEPFAFSNNAKPEGGPAKWQASSFEVPAGSSETRISFR